MKTCFGKFRKISEKVKALDNIAWQKADALTDEWGSDFEVVIIAGNLLFNLVTEMDYMRAQELLFEKASKALIPGGYLYIDYAYTMHPENWFNYAEEKIIFEGTDLKGNVGKMSLSSSSYDSASGMVKFLRKYVISTPDGEVIEKEVASMKHYATLEQSHMWLEKYGLTVEEQYGDYQLHPVGEDTYRAILIAKKK